MTRATSRLAAGSEFDEFLYASMGVESNGSLLSVLSALARLNVDPWEEASRLAQLPREAAIRFLANLIAAQQNGSSARIEPEMQARHLTALLPHSIASNSPASNPISTVMTIGRRNLMRYVAYYIVLTMFFLGAQWLTERSRQGAASGPPSAPTAGPASPLTAAPTLAPVTASARVERR
jgi:hypothetical protein